MNKNTKKSIWKQLLWPWNPSSKYEEGNAIVRNFLLHWFPNRITLKSLSFKSTMYLGTITFTLFMILSITGIILMFFYTPSIERAYWSIKDISFTVSFGWFLRRAHRLAAHLMVVSVFLHMFRVFYTSAYKNGKMVNSNRSYNWVIGVILFVLTLLLSFTGYLLPWDQLAYWAITVGTSIAGSVPIIGLQLKEFIIGGSLIGQNTLIRFYVLHVLFLPAICLGLSIYHMWRIRKDGGLAVVDQVRDEAKKFEPELPKQTKTYSILGIAKGVTAQVNNPTVIDDRNSRPSSPHLTMRLLNIILITCVVTLILSFFIAAPLETPANPEVTPNPAKAPWYFLGLQELVGYSALLGGIITPMFVLLGIALIPFIDKQQKYLGVWFSNDEGKKWSWIGLVSGFLFSVVAVFIGVQFPIREIFPGIESALFFEIVNPVNLLFFFFILLYFISFRITRSVHTAIIAIFSAFVIAFIVLTLTGTVLRGPNWLFYWPWQIMPANPLPY